MRGQTLTDTELLLELVGEAYGFEDLGQFRSGVLEILNRMVPCDWASYNEVAAEPEETFVVAIPEIPEYLVSIFSRLAHENPLLVRIRRTGDGRPYRFSDVIDQRALHGLALYQEVYRPLEVESQIAFTLPARSPLVLGIALSRGREDFSDREVQLLSLARPHLMQAYRNAELWSARAAMLAALEEGLDTLGRQIVVLDSHGRVEFATDGARRLLGDLSAMRRGLPEKMSKWIAECRGPRPPAEPLVLQTAGGCLLVRLLPSRRSDRRDVLLLEDGTGELNIAALRELGLTARQADTLRWVALGHSPSRVAAEMGIAPRTVDKHLQHIYARLGAPSLSQAIATAWAAVGVERPADGYRVPGDARSSTIRERSAMNASREIGGRSRT
jgi:DNA-binding CsgD family transcriptional regulator